MEPKTTATVTVDGYTRFCLTAIGVLLAALVLTLWAAGPAAQPAPCWGAEDARLILPDTAAQRLQLLEGIQGVNQRLDKIHNLLASGKLQVAAPKEKADGDGATQK